MSEQNIETIDSLFAGYVSGSLPVPLHVMVDAHLELSDANRPMVAAMENAAGDVLCDVVPVGLSSRDDALEAIFSSGGQIGSRPAQKGRIAGEPGLPRALVEFVGHSIDTIPWRTVMPGFREFDMDDQDGFHLSMFWIKPGRTMPAHTHAGSEITLVLDGAFTDQRGHFKRGDISIADASVDHRPVADGDSPCIGFAVTEGPLRLTGPLHQRLRDIITG
jgi:putative transcriptional regulator